MASKNGWEQLLKRSVKAKFDAGATHNTSAWWWCDDNQLLASLILTYWSNDDIAILHITLKCDLHFCWQRLKKAIAWPRFPERERGNPIQHLFVCMCHAHAGY